MATRITDYSPEITGQSNEELVEIARWLIQNKKTAYLVGGWAVYHYTKHHKRAPAKFDSAKFDESGFDDFNGFEPLGSKDIDFVFPNTDEKQSFEYHYCKQRGYKKRGIYADKPWTRTTTGTPPVDIIIDLGVLSDEWKERGITITWKHMARHNNRIPIQNGVELAVPTKELLLLYKCFAIVSRTDQLGHPKAEVIRLTSKIWKDAFDILALWDTGVEQAKLASLAKETSLERIVRIARQIIGSSLPEFTINRYKDDPNYLAIDKDPSIATETPDSYDPRFG